MSHDTLAEHAWRESDIAYCLPGLGKLSLCNTNLSALSMSKVAPWKYISTAADNALMSLHCESMAEQPADKHTPWEGSSYPHMYASQSAEAMD